MKIFMLGWEYPPKITGGLGIASEGLATALAQNQTIDFLIPKKYGTPPPSPVALIDASQIKPDIAYWQSKETSLRDIELLEMGKQIVPYLPARFFSQMRKEQKTVTTMVETEASQLLASITITGRYHDKMMGEIKKYSLLACQLAIHDHYEVVHAHDWPTFQAGMAVKKTAKLPLVVHFHSTEHDRNGVHPNPEVVSIEKEAVKNADAIICVSMAVKRKLLSIYKADERKISIVPNGITSFTKPKAKNNKKQVVGFVGRFTDQKSPGMFVDIAREIASKNATATFVMAGDGYLMEDVRNKIAQHNLKNRFTLTGFLDHKETLKLMSSFDLLIMPSTAEPFGLVALEAIHMGVPVITSSGCGINEFVPHLTHVDHWDLFSYTSTAMKFLSDPVLASNIAADCRADATVLTWQNSAEKVLKVYGKLVK